MLDDVLLKPLEGVLNRRIAASANARQQLEALGDRVLAIAVEGSPLAIYFRAQTSGLRLSARYDEDPDAVLRGTPVAIARLLGPEGSASATHVVIEGDAKVARRFQTLLEHARPDWEEELSRLVGDVAAHQAGNLVRSLGAWGRRAFHSLSADVAEFLQEESRELPARAELELLGEDLASFAERLENVRARLEHLERRTSD